MPLVLHLFKKDLRRTRLLLGFWLLLVAAQCAIMTSSLHPGDRLAQLVFNALSDTGPSLRTLVLGLLIAFLVQEESPAGTTAFWFTRPLPRSAVLGAKMLFGAMLLIGPVLAEIIVLHVAGVTRHDIAFAVPEVMLNELQIMLIAAVLAALTPNLARFAIAGVVVLVSLYLAALLANWLPNSFQRRDDEVVRYVVTVWKSRSIARLAFLAVGLAAAFAYQYLTRRTGRALAFAVCIEIGALAITYSWTWDLFGPQPKSPATATLDTSAVRTTLLESNVQDYMDYRTPGHPEKNIGGSLLIEGLPNGYVALPERAHPRLMFADGRPMAAKAPFITNWIFEPPSAMFRSALGKVFVYGKPWESTAMPTGLVALDADEFRKYAQQPLTFAADIEFAANRLVVSGRMPLAKGAHIDSGSEHKIITGVLHEGAGLEILLDRRYVNLLFARPGSEDQSNQYLVSFDQTIGNKIYALFNHRTREVVRIHGNSPARLNQPRYDARLVQESWQLSFGSDNMGPTPKLDDEWLADAELVELQMQPVAKFARPLEIKGFNLEGPNKSRLQVAAPPTDPEWLTRFALPEAATKAQMRKYVDDVVTASSYWHAEDQSELPVTMLTKVGPGNADVLCAVLEAAPPDSQSTWLLKTAVVRAAGPSDKAPVLHSLRDNLELVDAVVKFKWEADCRDTLLAVLRDERKNNLPHNWIVAVAALRDPASYPALKSYLVRTHSRQATYNAIRKLPGIELSETVEAAWTQAKGGSHAEAIEAAPMAIDVGKLDALEILIGVLRENDLSQPQPLQRSLTLVSRYVPITGDADALVKWFDANKGRLSYDAGRKKFLPSSP